MASNKTAKKPPVKQKIKEKLQKTEKKPGAPSKLKDNRLEMLFIIVNRNKAEYYADLMQSFEVNLELITLAHGTASSSTMALLHLNDSDKTLLMGVIQARKIKDALATLEDKFRTIRNGKGVAFTVPMTGVIGALTFSFMANNRMTVKDDKETKQ